jgi:hypothetical protein
MLAGIAADGVRGGPLKPAPDAGAQEGHGSVFNCSPCDGPQ